MLYHIKRAACLFTAVWGLAAAGIASEVRLSPALGCLEKKLTLRRCGIVDESVTVTADELDEAFGRKVSLLRVETLPDEAAGKLYIGALPAVRGQVISRETAETLCFVPVNAQAASADFSLADLSYEGMGAVLTCRIDLFDTLNLPPKTGKMSFETAKNVGAMLYLPVDDPEDDAVTFSVTRYPSHGTLTLTADGGGYFRYEPKEGYTGKDSFSYVACDAYGNTSQPARVSIRVSKPKGGRYFDDMRQHWAQNAALKVSAVGLFDDGADDDGVYRFHPDGTVTRGDFLAMALICAGREKDVTYTASTSFDDDADIPPRVKSYAAYAKANGIANGIAYEDGRVCFCSGAPITRAEAAVIVSRILSLADAEVTVDAFADGASVPHYAAQAMANVYASGVMKGVGCGEMQPTALVTRAQTAQILCEIMDRM